MFSSVPVCWLAGLSGQISMKPGWRISLCPYKIPLVFGADQHKGTNPMIIHQLLSLFRVKGFFCNLPDIRCVLSISMVRNCLDYTRIESRLNPFLYSSPICNLIVMVDFS